MIIIIEVYTLIIILSTYTVKNTIKDQKYLVHDKNTLKSTHQKLGKVMEEF